MGEKPVNAAGQVWTARQIMLVMLVYKCMMYTHTVTTVVAQVAHREAILLSKHGCTQQDVNRLLKATLCQRRGVRAIDTMACNGHKVTATCHDVAQNGQVPALRVSGERMRVCRVC